MIYTAKQFSVEQSIRNFIGSILVLLQESGCEYESHVGILDVKNTYASLTHGPGGVQTAFIDLQGPVTRPMGDRAPCRPMVGRQAPGGL